MLIYFLIIQSVPNAGRIAPRSLQVLFIVQIHCKCCVISYAEQNFNVKRSDKNDI